MLIEKDQRSRAREVAEAVRAVIEAEGRLFNVVRTCFPIGSAVSWQHHCSGRVYQGRVTGYGGGSRIRVQRLDNPRRRRWITHYQVYGGDQ